MTVEGNTGGETPTASALDQLIEGSLIVFNNQRFFQGEVVSEPYMIGDAVEDAIDGLVGLDIDDLFIRVKNQALIKPHQIKHELSDTVRGVDENSDYNDLLKRLVVEIVAAELSSRHPEAEEEEDRRYGEYQRSEASRYSTD